MPAMVVFPLARDLTFPLLSTLNRRRQVSSNVLSSSFLHLLHSLNCHRPNKAQDSTVRLPAGSHSVRPPLTLLSYLPLIPSLSTDMAKNVTPKGTKKAHAESTSH